MAQYWLQTPIENAKEVVQRFIDSNNLYSSGTVSYDLETEVIFYDFANNFPATDVNIIYFGTFVFGTQENSLELQVAGNINGAATLWTSNSPVDSGIYPYIIWNEVVGAATTSCYFVGYKFTVS